MIIFILDIYIDDATSSLNLSYCQQTLDLSAQSLDLSLAGQEIGYNDPSVNLSSVPSHNINLGNFSECSVMSSEVLNLTCNHSDPSQSSTHNQGQSLSFLQDLDQEVRGTLPPASSLPLPLSITQTLTSTLCNATQYVALDLQQKVVASVNNQTSDSATTTRPVADETKSYTCAQCAQCFSSVQELNNHRDSHFLSKPYSCNQCNARFTKIGTLNRHLKLKHTHYHSKSFQCELCFKEFAQSHDLKRHRQIHHK